MSAPTVSVIVPTFQRASTLGQTLSALRELEYPQPLLEIFVVDDGSTDSTRETVAGFPRVRYLWQPNSGVAKARNRGVEAATGDFLLFVDDDIIVRPDNVALHLAVHADYTEAIVSGHSEFADEIRRALSSSAFGRFRLWTEDVAKADQAERWGSEGRIHPLTVATQNFSISRHLFTALGGFDERFPVGAEDQDLCWRARAQGCVIVHDYNIAVIHNDQHQDLRALCRREERGAIGIVCLTQKHPDFPRPATLSLNGPLSAADSPRLWFRKVSRAVLSRPRPLRLLHSVIAAAEGLRPTGGWPLDELYRVFTGLCVFRGTRRGFQVTSREPWARAHRAE